MARSRTPIWRDRVLAHEQILQALIAQMAETEPEFITRLNRAFNNPDHLSRREHDYTDAAQHTEQFVREVIRLGAGRGNQPSPLDCCQSTAPGIGRGACWRASMGSSRRCSWWRTSPGDGR